MRILLFCFGAVAAFLMGCAKVEVQRGVFIGPPAPSAYFRMDEARHEALRRETVDELLVKRTRRFYALNCGGRDGLGIVFIEDDISEPIKKCSDFPQKETS